MAKQLSSTLRNLKFMQRATQREEIMKKEEDVKPCEDFAFPASQIRKCVVIMEGDPHPGAIKGRMSFGRFNPSVDKLNEVPANPSQSGASATSGIKSEGVSFRENGSSLDEGECSNIDQPNCESNGEQKRKQSEVASDNQHPKKSPKVDQQSTPNKNKGSFKKPKAENLDWKTLRRSKNQKQKRLSITR